jgi:hypothetical protein
MAPHAKLRFDTEPFNEGWPTEKDKALLMLGSLVLFLFAGSMLYVCLFQLEVSLSKWKEVGATSEHKSPLHLHGC